MRCSSSSLNKSREKILTAPARAVVESVRPQVDGGRYPAKRAIGDEVLVEADVFTDGHDAVVAELLFMIVSLAIIMLVHTYFYALYREML